MIVVKVYRESLKAYLSGVRTIANRGGTRSGKTYSIVSLLVSIAVGSKNGKDINIVSESMPHLKRGALKDIDDLPKDYEAPDFFLKEAEKMAADLVKLNANQQKVDAEIKQEAAKATK